MVSEILIVIELYTVVKGTGFMKLVKAGIQTGSRLFISFMCKGKRSMERK